MRRETMGRVVGAVVIENLKDIYAVELGLLSPEQVRSVEVEDALVDARVRTLSLPPRLIAVLGLAKVSLLTCLPPTYETVKLTIRGRDCVTYVDEGDENSPVRIGSVPCLAMDWVVDPKTNTLGGNPAHGGEWMSEAYSPLEIDIDDLSFGPQ